MISIGHLILIGIVVGIVVIISNPSYYKTVTQLSSSLSKIPRLLIISVTVLSLLGLSHIIDPIGYFQPHKITNSKTPPSVNEGKRLVSETTKKMVASRQQWKCGLCQHVLDETYEIDHIIPLYQGGSNDLSNLMALDPICHRKKTNADRLGVFVPRDTPTSSPPTSRETSVAL